MHSECKTELYTETKLGGLCDRMTCHSLPLIYRPKIQGRVEWCWCCVTWRPFSVDTVWPAVDPESHLIQHLHLAKINIGMIANALIREQHNYSNADILLTTHRVWYIASGFRSRSCWWQHQFSIHHVLRLHNNHNVTGRIWLRIFGWTRLSGPNWNGPGFVWECLNLTALCLP